MTELDAKTIATNYLVEREITDAEFCNVRQLTSETLGRDSRIEWAVQFRTIVFGDWPHFFLVIVDDATGTPRLFDTL